MLILLQNNIQAISRASGVYVILIKSELNNRIYPVHVNKSRKSTNSLEPAVMAPETDSDVDRVLNGSGAMALLGDVREHSRGTTRKQAPDKR